jgi:hypothetical protein
MNRLRIYQEQSLMFNSRQQIGGDYIDMKLGSISRNKNLVAFYNKGFTRCDSCYDSEQIEGFFNESAEEMNWSREFIDGEFFAMTDGFGSCVFVFKSEDELLTLPFYER